MIDLIIMEKFWCDGERGIGVNWVENINGSKGVVELKFWSFCIVMIF